jgi:hypothetical protein
MVTPRWLQRARHKTPASSSETRVAPPLLTKRSGVMISIMQLRSTGSI